MLNILPLPLLLGPSLLAGMAQAVPYYSSLDSSSSDNALLMRDYPYHSTFPNGADARGDYSSFHPFSGPFSAGRAHLARRAFLERRIGWMPYGYMHQQGSSSSSNNNNNNGHQWPKAGSQHTGCANCNANIQAAGGSKPKPKPHPAHGGHARGASAVGAPKPPH